jgi:hypothetical protein
MSLPGQMPGPCSGKRGQQISWGGVIAEGLADVNKAVHIARSKDKAAAKLERILAQPVLAVPAGLGALARGCIVLAQGVEQGSAAELDSAIGLARFVNKKREGNSGIFAEVAGVARVAQTDGHKLSSFFTKCLFVLAQLRDVLPAEDSAVVAQEGDYGRAVCPQRTKADWAVVDIR